MSDEVSRKPDESHKAGERHAPGDLDKPPEPWKPAQPVQPTPTRAPDRAPALATTPPPAIATAPPATVTMLPATVTTLPPAAPQASAADPRWHERRWAIRDSIVVLEELRDQILAALEAGGPPCEATRRMWMGDAKEAYYRTVASWQLLDGLHTRGQPPAEEVLQFLQTARSASKQAASELSGLAVREPASQATAVGWRRMHDDWLLAFERCAEEIAACAQPFRAPLEVRLPTRPVVEVSPTHFELPCALCGKTAVSFSTGVDRWSSKMALLFSGITHDRALNLALAAAAFEWLRREEIGKLHAHLIDSGTSHEGIDGYCPECDRVYCRQHYGAVEEFDEGFYDCTYGTCPAGHRRMIDD